MMCVFRRVGDCSFETNFLLGVFEMLAFFVVEFCGKAKVNDENFILIL